MTLKIFAVKFVVFYYPFVYTLFIQPVVDGCEVVKGREDHPLQGPKGQEREKFRAHGDVRSSQAVFSKCAPTWASSSSPRRRSGALLGCLRLPAPLYGVCSGDLRGGGGRGVHRHDVPDHQSGDLPEERRRQGGKGSSKSCSQLSLRPAAPELPGVPGAPLFWRASPESHPSLPPSLPPSLRIVRSLQRRWGLLTR